MKIRILILALFLTGCLFNNQTEADADIARQMELLLVAIDREVGTREADTLSQCDMLPFGAKPCGGPWSYLVFSEKNTDVPKLTRLVNRYNELDHELNIREGRVSDCAYTGRPEIKLENGICTGVGRGARNP